MINPIVVIDSGMGGLSVLSSLTEVLPKECFVFFADNANMPYGTKNQQQVIDISLVNLTTILTYQPKLIVLACNTLTACSVESLRSATNIPIVGCEPAILPALKVSRKRVLVLTTSATSKSEHFLNRFSNLENYDIFPLSELAQMIEDDESLINLENYLSLKLDSIISGYDVIVLGCTHFVLIKDLFIKLFSEVSIIDGNIGIANQVKRLLAAAGNLNKQSVCKSILLTMTSSDALAYSKYLKYIK